MKVKSCPDNLQKKKKKFNKELKTTKEIMKILKTLLWICDNVCVKDVVKVRNNCHISGKYRGFAHRDCNIKVKLNNKIFAAFPNLISLWFTSYQARSRQI